jgi:RNA polymerase sigma-70 factor
LRARLSRVASEHDFAEEVLQRVRARLLVGSKPRISTYRGDGPLGAWLHVVAANVARDYLRSYRKRRSCCCPLDAASARFSKTSDPSTVTASPEDDVLAASHARTLEQGLVNAMLELTNEERQLLHHYFVSGLSIDVLGAMYSINRATAARRIRRNVERLRQAVRRQLSRSAIRLGSSEFAAFGLAVGERLNVNASSLLGVDIRPAL